ncbi:hypothetical protein HHK36_012940 [Tetracentron sinense]|uniref:Uncharacterized protein n=1 Tax=Tetracentron sinense TaxID=13715 RepID=A0A835DJ67_TETSI|nr:hypothetical protein HHK36_012940 [Tetracentron sinense]
MNKMEEKQEDIEDAESTSSDSFIDDSDDDGPSTSGHDNESHLEATKEHIERASRILEALSLTPLTESEIEELIAEFLEVESKAAEAQESLEKEAVAQVETEVREELAQTLHGDDLEKAVTTEIRTFIEEWEAVLDELETESAHLLVRLFLLLSKILVLDICFISLHVSRTIYFPLRNPVSEINICKEQIDGAGIELPSLYKWIESQTPNGCCTEAWKKKTHWVGSQVTSEITESIADAEKYLQTHRPVRRQHGKLLEEGASGYLGKKFAIEDNRATVTENSEKDWSSFNKIFSQSFSENDSSFGSENWASVYLASTPQQAASLGLKLPGVDEVEEIDDIDGNSSDPFVADAIANERELDLSEEQKKNFRKRMKENWIFLKSKRL